MFEKTPKQHQAIRILGNKTKKNILLYGGSRSGKSAILCYAILIRAAKVPKTRHLILRKHFKNAKTGIWHDTLPKVRRLAFPDLDWDENRSDWFIKLPNKSEIWLGGLDDKERTEKILGTEYSTIYFNECSEMSYDSIGIAITRLAQKSALQNKAYFDCNPPNRKHWAYKFFFQHKNPITDDAIDGSKFDHLLMNPKDNLHNLSDDYLEMMRSTLSHRQLLRFEHGEWRDDIEGALWKIEQINKDRIAVLPQDLTKIIVAVDPAVSVAANSDETGIIVCAKSKNGAVYVLDDRSGKYSPSQWAKCAVKALDDWKAHYIVGEKNQGGDMVKHTLQTERKALYVKLVHASKGKYARTEPVVALYEQHKIHHVGCFAELEDQMCSWVPNQSTFSPDRVDALTWGIHELGVINNSDFFVDII